MQDGRGSAVIACSLDGEAFAERRARWQALRTDAQVEHLWTERGVRLTFRADRRIAGELQALVSLERDCCAFAVWSLRTEGDRLVLDITDDRKEAVLAVQAMFGRPTTRERD